jgi:hypothetical protein
MPTLTAHIARPARRSRAVLAAAAAYPAAWIAGLGVPMPTVDVDAPAADVLAAHAGHEGAFAVREVLVHGVAAVGLAVVVLALAAAVRRSGAERLSRVLLGAGAAAVLLSLTQMTLGCVLAGSAAPAGDAARTDALLDAINVLDGVKMLALAAVVAVGALAARRTGALPRRLAPVGAALVAALVVSAAGYLFAIPALALAAFVSLPLLLVWVTWAGVAVR